MITGLVAMPTVLFHSALSLLPDRSLPLLSRDRIAFVVPTDKEGTAAQRCLESIFAQTTPPDELVVSVNGGGDDTYEVVAAALAAHGCVRAQRVPDALLGGHVETWRSADDGAAGLGVIVVERLQRTGKSDSVNDVVARGLVSAERVLVADGDTIFDPRFLERLREHFYRLRPVGRGARRRWVVEDVALQSGNVTSQIVAGATASARGIAIAREAEYAFGSVLRGGQTTRLGDGRLLGRSRLFTVVGCGFAVRRELFPLPASTKTEDHDLTLRTQALPEVRTLRDVTNLAERGFEVLTHAGTRPLRDVLGPDEGAVEVRRGGTARFVVDAIMTTNDPPHLDGYLGQVERWHGGAIQNALLRARQKLSPNVAFAVWAAVVENLLGILLVAALLAGVAMHAGNPSLGVAPHVLLVALAVDLLLSGALVTLGRRRLERARGRSMPTLRAVSRTLVTVLPYALLRWLGPAIYVAAACTVVPEHLRRHRLAPSPLASSWERPTRRARTTSHLVLPSGVVAAGGTMLLLSSLAPSLRPINEEAWRLTHAPNPIRLERHVELVILRPDAPLRTPDRGALRGHSRYCDPAFTRRGRGAPVRFGDAGDADRYAPLSGWEVVALARLVPLIALFDTTLEAYGVPGHLYLRVLLNESYLDPLAVGATDDHGLSQQNGDSLTMLRTLSADPRDPLHNPRLFALPFSVYDPDFSLCAGAAKLAWALRQPSALSERHAYALYINPIDGVRNGEMSELHTVLTAAIEQLSGLAGRLEDAFAAHAADPSLLARRDREVLDVAAAVRARALTVEAAYRQMQELVVRQGLPDREHYDRLFGELFAAGVAAHR
jgi:cellulose synthase/poly-beta-1,6-N-acetylglucosamine synthase-like glycosyltransferase